MVRWGGEAAFIGTNATCGSAAVITIVSCGNTGLAADVKPSTVASKELTIRELLFVAMMVEKSTQLEGPVIVHCMNGRTRSASVVLLWLMRHRNIAYEEARRMLNWEMERTYGDCDNATDWHVDRMERFSWFVQALGSDNITNLEGCLSWHKKNYSPGQQRRSQTSSSPSQISFSGANYRPDVSTLEMFNRDTMPSNVSNVMYEGIYGNKPPRWAHPRIKEPSALRDRRGVGASFLVPAFVDPISMTQPSAPTMVVTINPEHFYNFRGKGILEPHGNLSLQMYLGAFYKASGHVIAACNIYEVTFGPRGSCSVYVVMMTKPAKKHPLTRGSSSMVLCHWVKSPGRLPRIDISSS